MAIKATRPEGKEFTPCPEDAHNAVCVDVVDLGMVESTWEGKTTKKHKVRIVFQVEETDGDNEDKRFIVMGWFVLSMHPKANLRKFLESWRGKPYADDDEAWDQDHELMIGAPALLQVVHNVSGGKTYANIDSIMKLPKGMKKIKPDDDYIRVKDREDYEVPEPEDTSYDKMPEALEDEDDSEVPF